MKKLLAFLVLFLLFGLGANALFDTQQYYILPDQNLFDLNAMAHCVGDLNSVVNSSGQCVSLQDFWKQGTGGGGGGTYTGTAPIVVDNDTNTISIDAYIPTEQDIDLNALGVVTGLDLNNSLDYLKSFVEIDPLFYSNFLSVFDGNFQASFDDNYAAKNILDINIFNICNGDANSVLTSMGLCQDLTDFWKSGSSGGGGSYSGVFPIVVDNDANTIHIDLNSINIIDENIGYQIDNQRLASSFGTNLYYGLAGNFTTSGNYNIFMGHNSGLVNTSGGWNTAIGYNANRYNTTGVLNVAVGQYALYSNTTGNSNTGIGANALQLNSTAQLNTGIGYRSLYNTTKANNTAIGAWSGYTGTTTTGSVFLGAYAGYAETGDNKLFIDNQNRGVESAARTDALIYGIFDTNAKAQTLYLNAGKIMFNQEYVFPAQDGDTNQILATNGDGNLFWKNDNAGSGGSFEGFDQNFHSLFPQSFDSNFTRAFDGNFHTLFQPNFDGNFHFLFQPSFDGNFFSLFQINFDENFAAKYPDLNANFVPYIGAINNVDLGNHDFNTLGTFAMGEGGLWQNGAMVLNFTGAGAHNLFVGTTTYAITTGIGNTAIGDYAGTYIDSGSYNTCLGDYACEFISTRNNNTFLGAFTGLNGGSNNVFIGYRAGENIGSSDNVLIGYMAATYNVSPLNNGNVLVISNSETNNPLIFGRFDANYVQINKDLNIQNDLNVFNKIKISGNSICNDANCYSLTDLNRLATGNAGGNDTEIQFNDGGAFGGDNAFTWNKSSNILNILGDIRIQDGKKITLNIPVVGENWLTGWSYRKKIVIDQTKIDADLNNLTVLVKLSASNFDFTKARSDGYDIVFTPIDNNTTLKFERERHNQTSSLGEYWIKIPIVSGTIDTNFYMYYGNASASDSSDKNNTWDANFVGVWHLSETPSASIQDSTAQDNDLTPTNMESGDQSAGQIDGSLAFDGSDEYLLKTIANFRSADSAGTITAWIKPTDFLDYRTILRSSDEATTTKFVGFALTITTGTPYAYQVDGDTADWITSQTAVSAGAWNHVALTSSGTAYKIYVAGASTNLTTTGGSNTGDWFADTSARDNLAIAATKRTSVASYFKGSIDEVRLSNILRSDAWIKAEYNSENNALLSFGSEEGLTEYYLTYANNRIEVWGGIELARFIPTSGHFVLPNDDAMLQFGAAQDWGIYADANANSNLTIKRAVGSGSLLVSDLNTLSNKTGIRDDGNITMTSPNGTKYNCGVTNGGSLICNT